MPSINPPQANDNPPESPNEFSLPWYIERTAYLEEKLLTVNTWLLHCLEENHRLIERNESLTQQVGGLVALRAVVESLESRYDELNRGSVMVERMLDARDKDLDRLILNHELLKRAMETQARSRTDKLACQTTDGHP